MSTEQLKELRALTDQAIETARKTWKNNLLGDAVNWSGLHCAEACWIVNDDGEEYAQVRIEEASPNASRFQCAIRTELESVGWSDVSVVTEW